MKCLTKISSTCGCVIMWVARARRYQTRGRHSLSLKSSTAFSSCPIFGVSPLWHCKSVSFKKYDMDIQQLWQDKLTNCNRIALRPRLLSTYVSFVHIEILGGASWWQFCHASLSKFASGNRWRSGQFLPTQSRETPIHHSKSTIGVTLHTTSVRRICA